MEQERRPYRNIFVCYDGYRQAGWRTREELQKLLDEGIVDYYHEEGKEVIRVGKQIEGNIVAGQANSQIQGKEDLDS